MTTALIVVPSSAVRPVTGAILVAILYVLHQDFWFWRSARPLVLGFVPIGLFYHAAFTVACALVMWLLVKQAWPAHLDAESPDLKVGPTHPRSASRDQR